MSSVVLRRLDGLRRVHTDSIGKRAVVRAVVGDAERAPLAPWINPFCKILKSRRKIRTIERKRKRERQRERGREREREREIATNRERAREKRVRE